jgi:hypothetical protein
MNRHLRAVWAAIFCLVLVFGVSSPLRAQTGEMETRIFDVRYANLEDLQRILSLFQVSMTSSASLRVMSVRAPKDVMPLVADAIKRLDVPPAKKGAELTIYVLSASDQQDVSGGPVPQSLQPVVAQLRNLFTYKNYRLVDTQILKGVDGERINANGLLPERAFTNKVSVPAQYVVQANFRVQSPDEKSPVLHLDRFWFNVQAPIATPGTTLSEGKPYTLMNLGIDTQVSVPAGQQVVVGKTTIGDSSLILVLSVVFAD